MSHAPTYICASCTFINEADSAACAMCGAPKSELEQSGDGRVCGFTDSGGVLVSVESPHAVVALVAAHNRDTIVEFEAAAAAADVAAAAPPAYRLGDRVVFAYGIDRGRVVATRCTVTHAAAVDADAVHFGAVIDAGRIRCDAGAVYAFSADDVIGDGLLLSEGDSVKFTASPTGTAHNVAAIRIEQRGIVSGKTSGGYGFLCLANQAADERAVFFHMRDLRGIAFADLAVGQAVVCCVGGNPDAHQRGKPKATRVRCDGAVRAKSPALDMRSKSPAKSQAKSQVKVAVAAPTACLNAADDVAPAGVALAAAAAALPADALRGIIIKVDVEKALGKIRLDAGGGGCGGDKKLVSFFFNRVGAQHNLPGGRLGAHAVGAAVAVVCGKETEFEIHARSVTVLPRADSPKQQQQQQQQHPHAVRADTPPHVVRADYGVHRHGDSYVRGAYHPDDEGATTEFKEIDARKGDVVDWLTVRLLPKLVNGFVNRRPAVDNDGDAKSDGGAQLYSCALFGVRDDGQIVGFAVDRALRDRLQRAVDDLVLAQAPISGPAGRLRPGDVQLKFRSVVQRDSDECTDYAPAAGLAIMELRVRSCVDRCPVYTMSVGHFEQAFERWNGSTRALRLSDIAQRIFDWCARSGGERVAAAARSIECDEKLKVASAPAVGDDEHECAVCMERPQNAAIVPCGHEFCLACIEAQMRRGGQCPLCRTAIERFTVKF